MNKLKELRLKKNGWEVGTVKDFLNLSEEEFAYVELKSSLSKYLYRKRIAKHLTQNELAHKLHSSQSRVAKMEKGDPTVSVDLLIRSLFVLGASKKELSKVIV